MPKKTKKQKLRADRLRRKAILHKSVSTIPEVGEKAAPTEIHTEPLPKKAGSVDGYSSKLVQFTMEDLRKTIVVTVFLFTLEFAIFYAKLKGIELESLKGLF